MNFWLEDFFSHAVSDVSEWKEAVRAAGGVISADTKRVQWPGDTGRRYAAFLLAHEIAHAVYATDHHIGSLSNSKRYADEDRWCDEWARQAVLEAFAPDPS